MKIQVKMTARDIFDFSMYSAYSGFAGIFTFVFLILVIGILGYAWSSVAVMQRVMLLGCIILFVRPADHDLDEGKGACENDRILNADQS